MKMMNSGDNSWNINPSDLLKTGNATNSYDPTVSSTMDMGFNDDSNIEDLFNSNYDEVDNLLTQELKDLDIPLIPQSTHLNGYSSSKNSISPFPIEDSYAIPRTPSNAHKRGPSGTAIFGFANHNKTLSISKMNRAEYDIAENYDMPMDFSKWERSSAKRENASIPTDHGLGHVLMKQQEELRIALERQQEVNRKLELQLQENKLQQERLQRVLSEQEAVAHQLVSENSSPQHIKTPISKNGSKLEPNEMIVTSNSNNGCYQFPPPSMISPPLSKTSVKGSPSRRPLGLRTAMDDKTAAPNARFPKYALSPALNESEESANTVNKNDIRGDSSNPFFVNRNNNSPSHRKKESILSTVSTIPHEDNESSDSEGLIGLGIRPLSRRASKDSSEGYSSRSQPVDIMPPIPGSTNQTPVKLSQLPLKHTFQHTPVKTQQQQSQHPKHTHESSAHEKLFNGGAGTPQLKPPPMAIVSSRKNSGFGLDTREDGQQSMNAECDGRYNSHDQVMNDEPESRFIIAKTPSPVLKSQGSFEGASPHFEVNGNSNGSPVKITRKPTTLPRGSIDRYVRELPNKLFECMYPGCHKIFKRRYNIRSHIQTHLEDRPYVCDFEGCNKAFVRNHDLVRHKKSHAEKTYACPCGKKFNREDALIVHRSRMICSGGKKYENVVIKKSPRRRGRPKKDEYGLASNSPVKESFARGNDGYLMYKMEEQLRNEMEKYGLLRPPSDLSSKGNFLLESPSSPANQSDLEGPLRHELAMSSKN